MNFVEILKEASAKKATDVYLITGAVPCINISGNFVVPTAAKNKRLSPQALEIFAKSVMSESQWEELNRTCELNIAFMDPNIGRFRVNALWQRGSLGLVMRRVEMNIPTLKELGLPPILRNVSLGDRGIVLISGSTGSGKSTTMASMLDYRNHLRTGHIVTIEDPIEFVYRHRRSIVTQREVGLDTHSFEEALKNSLRQAPQVISIGELRTDDTVQFAMHAAETGHLVFATLHSTNTVAAIERIMHFYPASMERQVLTQLSLNLKAIVCQRLVPNVRGGRTCATEVFMNSPRITELIARGLLGELKQFINNINHQDGTCSFDKSLYMLAKRGKISERDALKFAESENDLSMKFKGLGIPEDWQDTTDPWEFILDPYEPASDYHSQPEGYNNDTGVEMVSRDDIKIPEFQDVLMQSRRVSPKPSTPVAPIPQVIVQQIPVPAPTAVVAPAATVVPPAPESSSDEPTQRLPIVKVPQPEEESSSHVIPKKNFAAQQRVSTEFQKSSLAGDEFRSKVRLDPKELPQEFPPRKPIVQQSYSHNTPQPDDRLRQVPPSRAQQSGNPEDVVNRYRDMIRKGLPESVAEDLDSEMDLDET